MSNIVYGPEQQNVTLCCRIILKVSNLRQNAADAMTFDVNTNTIRQEVRISSRHTQQVRQGGVWLHPRISLYESEIAFSRRISLNREQ